ncbi:arylalkylamine N-acetyltransferase-like 2 [Halyomorpha halys]|uniref:arylalkylamine N-acetyltransferase-like 2 n=1 Tax=Halyomorpha halys TaxID=286706 RepID=UPI0006D4E4D2|nr:uncharacterized protein LOC106692881 [Halyomorpha halys]
MFIIRPCYTSDAEEVYRLLKEVYYPEEPLTKANRLQADIPGLTKDIIPQGHSVVAVSEEGKLVGVALNDEPPQSFPNIYTKTREDIKFQELFKYMERESRVLKAAPGALEVRMLAVDTKWRNLGIATALLDATKSKAIQARFPFMMVYCTSAHSSRLMSKLGWRLLYSLSYSRYLEEHPSGIIVPPEPHNHCKLFIYQIDQPPVGDMSEDRVMSLNETVLRSNMLVRN